MMNPPQIEGAVVGYAGQDISFSGEFRGNIFSTWVYQDGVWWVGGKLTEKTRSLSQEEFSAHLDTLKNGWGVIWHFLGVMYPDGRLNNVL